MARSGTGARQRLGGLISIIATAAFSACFAAPAMAATGGAPTPSGSAPPPPSRSGAPSDSPSAGNLRLIGAQTTPRKSFYFGVRAPRLRYEVESDQSQNDLRIDIVNADGAAVRSYFRNDVEPGSSDSVRWDGTLAGGKPAPNGRYSFRIAPQSADPATRQAFARSVQGLRRLKRRARSSSASPPLSLSFALYGYAFPVLGPHDYGQSGARFGAGRSGHSHQGQDVMARCGTPLVAARGGRVRYSGFQGAAGNYVVIDGRGTGYDTAYMHLLQPSPLKAGMTVRTGQPIGVVGSTGSSTACHLHFELWTAPGWYEGGSPIDPLALLKKWDSYS
ncbi:MAG TPA: peptidoglycan DD-metalloendopeptidase family protein [Solirubrobacterales bacterium]|nr:peptidoglycan DD-metalloendopeptidase family protein [Solirubrobacterales bacterium]